MPDDIYLLLGVGAAGLGVILGSFLNALLFRFNTGRGMGGRSRCMRCNHELGALDLVPLLSYLFLGGRCRYCSCAISWQYPLVEAVGGVLSVGVYVLYPTDALLYGFWLLVWMTLLFIVVYDARHMIIPWSSSLFLLFLSVLYLVAHYRGDFFHIDVAAGVLLALPLFLLSLVSRGTWMGWADSLLELSLGSLLGLSAGGSALLFGVWSGAIIGITVVFLQRLTPTHGSQKSTEGFTMRSEIPFGPYLALGAAIAFFFHVNLFSTISLF